MAKQVVLAVAGAGKTYHICHNLDVSRRNLLIAFSHENIHNIRQELLSAYGRIPELTTVSTFDSFVYHNFILPYESSIAEYFNHPEFESRGICVISPPNPRIKNKTGKSIHNPNYVKKELIGHYITKENQYYCATLSELALQIKKRGESLVKRAVRRLNLFFDTVLVDEFQDFRKYDFELILLISKYFHDIVLVGDYYQHSVSAINNSGKPFDENTSYESFVLDLEREGFRVDQSSLVKSRRCSKEVCAYVTQKLGIKIASCEINNGAVVWADEFAEDILNNDEILKLVYNNSDRYKFRAMNWSYSKGDTVKAACVILTSQFENLSEESFCSTGIPTSTLNKLYVAMTRSCGDLYLIKSSTFKKLMKRYQINGGDMVKES